MIKEIKEYIKNLATLPNRLERIELLLKENTDRHYLLSTIDERSSNAYTNLEALNERSSNAYTILEALNGEVSTILECFDCPRCGCQNMLNVREGGTHDNKTNG